ncbi:MAG: 16S rRNA (cytidine(1402)-2'-O)-methyltransferase [Candidatus Saganbacteria bacterium]|nr:16S rRNA (cytidine(1402)-2'-O)-methyltransferase [Candidatus Saganbacteria bacterium]
MGILYVVATPIGNLEDITLRAIRTLKEVDAIASEDTRQTKKLLNKYEIKTSLISYYSYNIKERTPQIINMLKQGKNIALVTDAGTPAISDPGEYLVHKALEGGIKVVTIPGPSAVIAALSIAGLSTDKFIFEGFLPRKSIQRCRLFEQLKEEERTVVFYESPHRILKTLDDLIGVLPERKIVVARELTKIFEEIVSGTPAQVRAKIKPKGEMVLIVEASN